MKKLPFWKAVCQALLCVGLFGGFALLPSPLAAQSGGSKTELLAKAQEARLQGDFAQANEYLEELMRMDPDNSALQSIFERNKQDMERTSAGQQTTMGRAADGTQADGTQADGEDTDEAADAAPDEVEALISQTNQLIEDAEATAEQALADAEKLDNAGLYDAAADRLIEALNAIPKTAATEPTVERLQEALAGIMRTQIRDALEEDSISDAEELLNSYVDAVGRDSFYQEATAAIRRYRNDPRNYRLEETAPEFVERQEAVEKAVVEGRARYLMGDLEGARQAFNRASKIDPNNVEAKAFLARIANTLTDITYNDRSVTRSTMLEVVARGWTLPGVYRAEEVEEEETDDSETLQQLQNTVIPFVRFTDVPLDRAMETLAEASIKYSPVQDADGNNVGVNIVLFPQGEEIPRVSVTLNQSESLDTILELVTSTVDWQYTIGEDDVIRVEPRRGGGIGFRTEFYDITQQILIKMGVERPGLGGGGADEGFDPFAPPGGGGGGGGGDSLGAQGEKIREFFENAGVDFQGISGASLAFTGNQIIVTHRAEAHDQILNILRQFVDVEQVEIEARFLEVEQGVLQELGFDWNVNNGANNVYRTTDGPNINAGNSDIAGLDTASGNLRSLSSAFATASSTLGNGSITTPLLRDNDGDGLVDEQVPNTTTITNQAPTFPGALNLAANTISSANIFGVVDDWNINVIITALEQQTGSDLMSAPRLTVLSGKTAEIVVAQELRYPESYGDIESNVSTGDGDGGGGSGVSITAGTPQDFTTRRVGVEMEVQPTVEGRDRISLRLEPRVTEFEGFVEYGGQSVAVSGSTVVTVPSGFFQPIFSVREIRTEVTVFDGATVIMGGLTREEVARVEDSVPVLGNIPLLGRLFRSEGESSLKTNLMIFVTARLISPGGAPLNEETSVLNQVFKPSTIMTPGGPIVRQLDTGGGGNGGSGQ
jgi:general secretion pathway protein D